MLSRLITIISLLVFFFLLLSGSTLEPALIKSAVVFFTLAIGFKVCRYLVNIIRESAQGEQESSPSHNSA